LIVTSNGGKKKMKKILILLAASIIVLSGLIAGAVSINQEALHTQDWAIEIDVEGGLFGYTCTIRNVGEESVIGNLTMNIITDARFMLLGRELSESPIQIELAPGEFYESKTYPVLGFGSAFIGIEGGFILDETPDVYPFETEANGFILLFFIRCDATPIVIP
jgi:hypothetical protein